MYVEQGNRDSFVHNCVLWGNTGSVNPADLNGPGTEIEGSQFPIQVRYTDTTYNILAGGNPHPGEGNIDADPLFVSVGGQDYQLQSGSPCVDAGDNARIHEDYADLDDDGVTFTIPGVQVGELTPLDLLLQPRMVPTTTDMGAFERQ